MANEFKIKKGLIVTGASGGTVVDIQGSQGQLFSVTDDLSGDIFAVSDISGVPIFTVNSSGLSTFDGLVSGITPVNAANFVTKAYVDGGGGAGSGFLPLSAGSGFPLTDNLFIRGDDKGLVVQNAASTTNVTIGAVSSSAVSTGLITLRHLGVTKIVLNANDNSYFTGNVGIGVTGPVGKFQVALPAYTNEDTNSQQAIFGVASGYGVRIGYNETDNKGYINVLKPGVAWGSLILQEDVGKVGIGTTSPQASLQIGGNVGTSSEKLDVRGNSSANYVASFEQDHVTGYGVLIDTDGTLVSEPALKIKNQGGNILYVGSNGDVGIGATSPGEKLEVSGGNILVKSSNNGGGATNNNLILFDTDTTASSGQGIGSVQFYGSDASGAGAGIKSEVKVFYANDGDSSIMTFSTSDSSTNNQERMRISSAGNVNITSGNLAIGTTTVPAQRLDVAGNVVIPYANGYLMDTTGAGGSNFVKTINDYETVVGTDRGSAGFGVFGNSNIRLGFGTAYTTAQTKLTLNTNGLIQFNAYNLTNQTGTPTYMLGTDASGNVVKVLGGDIPGGGGTVTGTGTANYLSKWATTTSLTNSNVYVSSQGVSIGTTTPSFNTNYGYGDLNVENNSFASAQVFSHNSTAGNYSFFGLGKSSGTGANPTIVQAQETVGAISYYGYDGAAYKRLATISADVDGTPGAGDMPGRLEFFTTADGASSPTKRLTIGANGTSTFVGLVSGITPVAAANFVTKAYVDGSGGGTGPFLPLAGGTVSGPAATGAYLVTIENTSSSTATSYGLLVKGGGNSSSGKTFEVQDSSGNSDFIVKGNGNVGIGTTLPDTKTHIQGASAVTGAFYDSSTVLTVEDTNPYIQIIGTDGGNQASSLILTTVPAAGTGDNKNWAVQHRGTTQNGNFGISYDTTSASGQDSADGTDLFVIETTGNVGIGTVLPIHPLYVAGDIGQTDGSRIWFRGSSSSSTTGSQSYVYSNGLNLQIKGDDNVQLLGDGGGVIAHFDYTGNVGINNTSPAKKLEISSATSGDGILLTGDGTGGGMSTGSYRGIGFSYTDADTSYGSEIKFEIPDSAEHGGQISFWTDVTTGTGTLTRAMTIDRNQNVGIGTSTPLAKLDIQGTQGQLFSVTDDLSGSIFAVSDISGVPIFDVNSSGVSYFDGNVGIGTDNPGDPLHVYGTIRTTLPSDNSYYSLFSNNGSLTLDTYGVNSGIQFKTLGSTKLTITNGGNVIVGATAINGAFGASNTILAVKGSTSGGEGIIQITGLGNNATDNVGALAFHSQAEADAMCSIVSIRGNSDDVGSMAFLTNNGGTNTERMRIDNSGSMILQDGIDYTVNAPTHRGVLILAGPSAPTNFGGIEFHTNPGGGAGYGSKIYASDATWGVATRSNATAFSNRFAITGSTGNAYFTDSLGIGLTTTPLNTLHVAGSVRATSGVYFNSTSTLGFKIENDFSNNELDLYGGALNPAITLTNSGYIKFGNYGLSGASGVPVKLLGLDSNQNVVAATAFNTTIDDQLPTTDAAASGTIVNWTVSESTTAGLLYVVKSNGGWMTTDADTESRSIGMLGIALSTDADEGMLLQGFFYKSSHGFTVGLPLYISNTAGAFTNTRPTGANDYVRIIGYATSTNYIYFDPDKTWIQLV